LIKSIKIWEDIFPQRQIRLDDGKVTAKIIDKSYIGNDMSDGEKAAII